jgi:hypothetical protein
MAQLAERLGRFCGFTLRHFARFKMKQSKALPILPSAGQRVSFTPNPGQVLPGGTFALASTATDITAT